jgi:hypothetical protein
MERIRWLPKPPNFRRDVEVYLPVPLGSGILWVRANSGGASTNEIQPQPTAGKRIWVAQSGVTTDLRLNLREEPLGSGHWVWEAAQDMPYAQYYAALSAANGLFR